MPINLLHRQARKDHVAEAPSPAVFCRLIDRHARHGGVTGQQRGEQGELIFARAAAEIGIGEVVGDFLNAQNIEIGEPLRFGHDACRIDAQVDAAAPLNVPRQKLHRIPARMND